MSAHELPHTSRSFELGARRLALVFLLAAIVVGSLRAVGGYSTCEPDFYGVYAPQAQHLLAGLPYTHTRSGPGYSFLLALGSFAVPDLFVLAKILAALGVALIGYVSYRLALHVASARIGLWLQALVYITLFRHALIAGNDVICAAFATLALLFLVRHERARRVDLLLAGVFAGLATITRYTALALCASALLSLLVFLPSSTTLVARLRNAALYVAGFLLASGPWWILNAIWNGSAFSSQTHALLALDAYGKPGTELSGLELGLMEQRFTSWSSVLSYDPARLLAHLADDFYRDVNQLFEDLATFPAYLWIGLGVVLLVRQRPSATRQLASLALFAALGFALAALVPYQSRYHMAILPVLLLPIAAALSTLTSTTIEPRGLRVAARISAFATVLAMVGISAVATLRYVRDQATEILPAAAILQRTARPQDFVVARKPHIAFTGHLEHLPPLQTDDRARFFAWLTAESGARFLYVGPSEVGMLPFLEPLAHGLEIPAQLQLLHQGVAPADALYAVR